MLQGEANMHGETEFTFKVNEHSSTYLTKHWGKKDLMHN